MINITVENVSKVMVKMAKYNLEVEREFTEVVKKNAKEVQKKAKERVPIGKTKNLRQSIKPKYFKKGHAPSATVFPRGKKGSARHLIEYGTRTRRHRSGKSVGRVTARPFMKPAQDSSVNGFLLDVRKVINKDVVI